MRPIAGIDAAIAASHLRLLSSEVLATLTEDARHVAVAAGATLHHEGDSEPHLELVVSGLIRVYVMAPDGRTMTVRYCRPGSLLGAVSLFGDSFVLPATIQAIVHSELVALRPATVVRLVERDTAVATALFRELSERVTTFIAEIPSGAFATVRQRISRHLLDLASDQQSGPVLIARVTQQELAEAVGTVREVVVRVLRELRADGVVRTGRRGIEILRPEVLVSEVGGVGPGGT